MYKCYVCSSPNIKKIVDLGSHPLADTFLPERLILSPEVTYPLQLGLCSTCGHVSTLHSISAIERYQAHDYSYDSSNSPVSIAHFKEFAETVLKNIKLNKKSLVADIGSNVGTLLSHFIALGYSNVIGIEPSRNISLIAEKNGIHTINDFFNDRVGVELNKLGGVDLLVSANVLNHADDINSVLQTAKATLNKEGLFVFEVPYLLDLLKNTAFDTIYHEHVHYFGIKSLSKLLRNNGFSILKIEYLEYMCGSVRVYSKIGFSDSLEVTSAIEREEFLGLYRESTYSLFMSRIRKMKFEVVANLSQIRADGGKIIGIGAATKGNTFLNYCKLDSDTISYITDTSALKIGKFTPGSRIPIRNDSEIDGDVTHALILPWNIAPMLINKLSHLNLKFYIPQIDKIEEKEKNGIN